MTNLPVFTSVSSGNVCDKGQLDVLYFEFSKAFDIVHHTALLSKLSFICVCSKSYSHLEDYLKGKASYVCANRACYSTYTVTSGVT